ncbi:RNA polymerase-associated protein LEO1 [Trichoplax sp. H2]|nr:RNA polymerase-associated protein LEO1 [Trichoplax sp. H2]|eukprot:RDD47511.1 RNA polymerase-associated protein LEO1 [Trichoplax sp. H2]
MEKIEELFSLSEEDRDSDVDFEKVKLSSCEDDVLEEQLFGNIDSDTASSEDDSKNEIQSNCYVNINMPENQTRLGSDLFIIRLPNFLSVEPKIVNAMSLTNTLECRPFNSINYEDEFSDDEVLDEEGRARLKLRMENTIRWRKLNKGDSFEEESNAKIVEWSDGSMTLHLGSEIFDIFRSDIDNCNQHLFTRELNGLQGKVVLKSRISIRPHSTESQTHRKMTLSIADKCSKAQKICILPAIEKNPEYRRHEMIKKEEEKLRASIRRENQQRRIRERSHTNLTPNYLEMIKQNQYVEPGFNDSVDDFEVSEEETNVLSSRSVRKSASSESDDEFTKRKQVETELVNNKKRRILSQAVVPSDDDDST